NGCVEEVIQWGRHSSFLEARIFSIFLFGTFTSSKNLAPLFAWICPRLWSLTTRASPPALVCEGSPDAFFAGGSTLACPAGRPLRRCRCRRGLERARVHRPDEGDDPPEVIAGLDDAAKGRHWRNHDFMLHAGIASFCQSVRAERYQGEKRVVVAAVNPCVIRERRTHAASAASPMAAIAAGGEVSVVTLLGNGSNIGVVGIFQLSLRGAGDKVQGRCGGAKHGAASGCSGRARSPRSRTTTCSGSPNGRRRCC